MKIICIDFDGVLNSYVSGWEGAGVISDPPTEGAMSWLLSLCDDLDIEPAIYSSRSRYDGAVDAIKEWLVKYGFPEDRLNEIKFPTQKPAAFLTLDDRAMRFTGEFPSIELMNQFKPWNKNGESAVEEAVRVLTFALSNDSDFYDSYKANIAVAIKDEFEGKLSKDELHTLSNNAAIRFMSWWVKDR